MNYISALKHLPKQDVIEVYHKMNCWEWDNRLGKKPEHWESIPDFMADGYRLPTKADIIAPLLREIEKNVKEKELSKHWVVTELRSKTRLQFEIWWIKRKVCKALGIGFYSKRRKALMRDILTGVEQSYRDEWIKKQYGQR